MGWRIIDIEYCQAVGRQDAFRRRERKLRIVFVVDCIELVVAYELQQVRKLEGGYACRFQ